MQEHELRTEKVQSAQTPHAHEDVGERPVGAVEGGAQHLGFLLCLHPSPWLWPWLPCGLTAHGFAPSMQTKSASCSRFQLPAAGPLPLLSPPSSAFPLPHPGGLYRSAGSFRRTGGARPSGLWDAAASRPRPCSVPRASHPTASHHSRLSPLAGTTFQADARFHSADRQDSPASRSLPWVSSSSVHAQVTALAPQCHPASGCFPHPGRIFLIRSQWFPRPAPGLA